MRGNGDTQIICSEGKNYRFSREAFGKAFDRCRTGNRMKTEELENSIAEKAGCSVSAVHHWRTGENGPEGEETLKKLAEFFGMSDWRELTKETFTAGDSANSLTADQKQSAKRVYEECISFLDEFLYTDGFMNFCHGTCGSSSARELEEIVETKRERLVTALDMERFLLKGTDIYAGFEEYIYDVLPSIS